MPRYSNKRLLWRFSEDVVDLSFFASLNASCLMRAIPPLSEFDVRAFRQALFAWHRTCERPMPWKGLRDPYLIWLSEVILQQTRVEQGLLWFERFRKRFPTVHHLAAATEAEVLKLWEGLGYYARARNLWRTARHIVLEWDGRFPETYEGLLQLKGVGPYTAAAVASFAYGLPHAVVDGNVLRVLSRFFADDTPIDTAAGKRRFQALADRLIDPRRPGPFNQAMMDLGATTCVPVRPSCGHCPLAPRCRAHARGQPQDWPVKRRKQKVRMRHLHYFACRDEASILLLQRPSGDVWAGLFDFPWVEAAESGIDPEGLFAQHEALAHLGLVRLEKKWRHRQRLSHQLIHATYWEARCTSPLVARPPLQRVPFENLRKFALPKLTGDFCRRFFNFKHLPKGADKHLS